MEERASSSSLRDILNSFGLRSGLCETRKVRGRRFFKGIKGVGIFWSFPMVSFFSFPSVRLPVCFLGCIMLWLGLHTLGLSTTDNLGRAGINLPVGAKARGYPSFVVDLTYSIDGDGVFLAAKGLCGLGAPLDNGGSRPPFLPFHVSLVPSHLNIAPPRFMDNIRSAGSSSPCITRSSAARDMSDILAVSPSR